MQILSAEQIRLWDEYTIKNEPISSIELMERAAESCLNWLEENDYLEHTFHIFCGKGNNGGDGLALARMLSAKECRVFVNILEFGHKGTQDFQINLARLHETAVEIRFVQSKENFYDFPKNDILIDSLFGSGLNRPLEGISSGLIERINASGNQVISIDIPSGLYTDKSSLGNPIIRAKHTLCFESYKLAFLMPENEPWVGQSHILSIGLKADYLQQVESNLFVSNQDSIRRMIRHRNRFANKGTFGHALLVCGSYGKMGAAVLSARACLSSGVGLLTCHVPGCGNLIMQTSIPESMLMMDKDEHINTEILGEISKFSSIGIGPGIGTEEKTASMLERILKKYKKPFVVDADALNILSSHKYLLPILPSHSILTPHPKEFERLFGPSKNDFERLNMAIEQAHQTQCIIVLKGHYTLIALPTRIGYFNTTGNPGMAKGGSGDALTGIITSFLAQGYPSQEAALIGVYVHGLAGDKAALECSEYSMLASDIIDHLGKAFRSLVE
jgi:ADP-dependent NAD(P)H-hydrate dehydratase / NAD(P)H-hydrate epimerase